MKNKYDTSVVFLYAIGKEHLLPEEFRKKIPYSTISTWRKRIITITSEAIKERVYNNKCTKCIQCGGACKSRNAQPTNAKTKTNNKKHVK